MVDVTIINKSIALDSMGLTSVFAAVGMDFNHSIAKTLLELENDTNTRWQLSTIGTRPIKWVVAEKTDGQTYLYFAKAPIQGQSPGPVDPEKLFSVEELSALLGFDLSTLEHQNVNPAYKGKVLGPVTFDQGHGIIKMAMLKNFADELNADVAGLAAENNFVPK